MPTTTIHCDAETLEELNNIASAQNRSRTWVINQALDEYIAREHKRTQFKADVLASWNHYQEIGLHVTGDELASWLETWGNPLETEAPQCHK